MNPKGQSSSVSANDGNDVVFDAGKIRSSCKKVRSETEIVFEVDDIHQRIKAAEETKANASITSPEFKVRFCSQPGKTEEWRMHLRIVTNEKKNILNPVSEDLAINIVNASPDMKIDLDGQIDLTLVQESEDGPRPYWRSETFSLRLMIGKDTGSENGCGCGKMFCRSLICRSTRK